MKERGLFFTGTDTGVGKTVVTATVARILRGQGLCPRLSKPVATGASQFKGGWVSEDTVRLAAAGEARWEEVTGWTFREPAAPPVAARQEGVTLTLAGLVEAVAQARSPGSPLLVEGVGGLLCPLTERETVADLAAVLGLPLIVVARRSLGTLNHTLLTVEAALRRGLTVAGVVINETSPPEGLAELSNVEELRCRLDVPVLAVVPYQAGLATASPGTEADRFPSLTASLAGVDWRRLAEAQTGSSG